MSRLPEKAWDKIRTRLAKQRDLTIDDAEELMQECLYQLCDFWGGSRDYRSEAAILDDYLGLSVYYLWVFKFMAGL